MNVKTNRGLDEESEFLLNSEEGFQRFHRISYPVFHSAIAKGVANNVGKWPSHLFAAFLAASLVFAAFLLFALVTAILCMPTVNYKCRNSNNFEPVESPNVYYVKDANRTWSREELCYIESSIRDNPHTNVYLINLMTGSQQDKSAPKFRTQRSKGNEEYPTTMHASWEEANHFVKNTIDVQDDLNATTMLLEGTSIRRMLDVRYTNVRNVDVTIEDFFKGSMLARESKKLDTKTLEIAAKAYLLWNSSGVALNPSDYRRLGYLREYLCREECKIINIASIDPAGSILASGVPCQAFVGYLLHEIALNGVAKDRNVVMEARESFCKRQRECLGLKMLNQDSCYIYQSPSCPTIYPSGFPTQNNIS